MKNILHISDIHVSETPTSGMTEHALKNLLPVLLDDLGSLPKVDTLLITGDIANAGQTIEYRIFQHHFLAPLLTQLEIDNSRVLVVPGNHDSNRKEWKKSDTLARHSLVAAPQKVSIMEILQEKISDEQCKWAANFTNFRDELDASKTNKLIFNKFFSAYEMDGIGIGCINSSWLANADDKGSLFVSEWQFQEILRALKPFKNKLILMHHPLDWLELEDKKTLANYIHSSNISCLFYGHMHEFMMTKESQFSEDSVLKLQAGRLDTSSNEIYCGYSLISLHEQNTFDSGEIFFRKFDSKKRVFKSWNERTDNGKASFSLTDSQPFDPERFAERCKQLIYEIEFDLLCNIGLPSEQQKKLSEIFILPTLAIENESSITEDSFDPKQQASPPTQYQTLKSLFGSPESFVILGSENSGKSTLAKRLVLHYLSNQSSQCFDHVVFYLDLRGKTLSNAKRINRELLSFYLKESNEPTYQAKIEKKLTSPGAIIIFDSVEHADVQSLKSLFEYIETSPARIMVLGQLSARPMLREMQTKICKQKKLKCLNLRSLKRSHLKELVSKWQSSTTSIHTNKVATRALKVVNGAGMANNPFVYSMLLSISERKASSSRTYMHEADLVENFIEIIMQKHVIPAGNVPQYKDLLLFLGYVATHMYKTSCYAISENTLLQHALDFNKVIAQNFDANSIIGPILNSSVMKKTEGIGFRFSQLCFFNYALAYWIAKQDLDYAKLDNELNFTRFDKSIEYVSALKSDLKLLDYLSKKIETLWCSMTSAKGLTNLESAEQEVLKCAGHDIIDMVKSEALESTFSHSNPNENEYDEKLDQCEPLTNQPQTEIKESANNTSIVVAFHETLSLYARSFRAAEHLLDPDATFKHLENIFSHYMNSIAFGVRVFDKDGRPAIISLLKSTLEYEKTDEGKRGEIEAQVNAFVNFVIAAIPNFGVAMMSSDFFNQRQRARIENLRTHSTNNLEKILLTYCLCELDDIDVLHELKSQIYEKPHESSSLILKLIELIFLNFSISENEKEKLKTFAQRMIKDRKTNQLFKNYAVVSQKIGQSIVTN